MAHTADKFRFVECKTGPDGKPTHYILPNQVGYTSKGQAFEWICTHPVIFADAAQAQKSQPGEVYACVDLVFWPQKNCYMVNGKSYRVVDEDGIYESNSNGDSLHADLLQKWEDYDAGKTAGKNTKPGKAGVAPAARVLSQLEKVKKDPRLLPPTIEEDGFWVDNELWYDLILCARNRKSVMLTGPKGQGKTELVQMVALKLAYEFAGFDMAIQNPYSYLCGNTRLTDSGETVFQYARFAEKIQSEDMIICLLDELSRCAPAASNILLPVLDRRKTLYVENAIDENGRELAVGEKVSFWATANMGAEYIGVSGIDEALSDRFVVLEIGFPPKAAEAKLLQVRCGLDSKMSMLLATFAEQVRKHKDLSTKISTRKLLEVGDWVSWGHTPKAAVTKVALSIWPTDEVDGGERQTVNSILQAIN